MRLQRWRPALLQRGNSTQLRKMGTVAAPNGQWVGNVNLELSMLTSIKYMNREVT